MRNPETFFQRNCNVDEQIALFERLHPNQNIFAHQGIIEQINESEDNTMLHKVTITKPEEKVLEEYWLMRAINENVMTKAKTVVKESECTKEPTLEEIALFLANSGGNFVSVEHNYRFADLPF